VREAGKWSAKASRAAHSGHHSQHCELVRPPRSKPSVDPDRRSHTRAALQGQSLEPMASNKEESERFRATARAFDQTIRDAGARTVLYMTWAYRDKPEMTNLLSAGYVAAGDELGALVVPVGLAFERSRRENPPIDLYYPDGKHPNLEGTYLAACVFYAALYSKSPEGNAYVAGLSADVGHVLRQLNGRHRPVPDIRVPGAAPWANV
jgi:hypothetical protein